jgi:hypothetical protein
MEIKKCIPLTLLLFVTGTQLYSQTMDLLKQIKSGNLVIRQTCSQPSTPGQIFMPETKKTIPP